MNNLPLTLDKRALARLLSPIIYKCESTLIRDFDRSPDLFPQFERLGGKKIFETQKVIDFYPPGIGAAIRRALERELKIVQAVNKPRPPVMGTLAEDLMAANRTMGAA